MTVSPEHDGLSPWPATEPYWSESAAFCFNVPELGTIAHIGMWLRPNIGVAMGGIAVWDDTGHEVYDCRYFDVDWTMKVPEDADGTSARMPNGLTVERVRPMDEYRLTFESEECTADITWKALGNAHGFSTPNSAGLSIGQGHYEQIGRGTGSITVRGAPFEIDCYSLRDRSFGGPRNSLGFMPSGANTWAIADPDTSFHLLLVDNAGPEPIVAGGFITLDGVTADVRSGVRHVLGRDGHHVTRFRIEATDALGRDLHVECDNSAHLRWLFVPRQYVQWSMMRCEIAGRVAWGEDQDFYDGEDARAYLRAPVSAQGDAVP